MSVPLLAPTSHHATGFACSLFRADAGVASRRPLVLVGHDATFVALQKQVAQFADADSPVLILGETGTGKELVARAIHLVSPRRAAPFVCTNCAQYQDANLAVSQLFGHRKGSFTGAAADHTGLFEAAHNGSLFLDEVGELPLVAQALLLRAIGEGEILRLGDNRGRAVDVRLIAATARTLVDQIDAQTFRRDLYHRLKCFCVVVPPLRRRPGDIVLLIDYFMSCLNHHRGCRKLFDRSATACLLNYSWPGNVRELRAVTEFAFYKATENTICVEDLPPDVVTATEPSDSPDPAASRGPHDARRHTQPPSEPPTDFWRDLHRPFMKRDLNREQVRTILTECLQRSAGSYRDCLLVLGVRSDEYLRAMDFLRFHDLKPHSYRRPVRGRTLPSPRHFTSDDRSIVLVSP